MIFSPRSRFPAMTARRARLADLLDQLHHRLGGAAVAWPFQGADGGDNGGVEVRQRGGGDAGGEGGGVGAVLRV
jgi:hypothetical protein